MGATSRIVAAVMIGLAVTGCALTRQAEQRREVAQRATDDSRCRRAPSLWVTHALKRRWRAAAFRALHAGQGQGGDERSGCSEASCHSCG